MDSLTKTKLDKLDEQSVFSNQLHEILTKEGGLVQTSDRVCKNLVAAVAVSQRPGFFEYYQTPPEVQRVYDCGECRSIVRKISRTQQEIDHIDRELAERAHAASSTSANVGSPEHAVCNLDQWFSSYGRPKEPPAGFVTSFQKVSKIYGATAHHRAFKSQAMTMKKGRLTN